MKYIRYLVPAALTLNVVGMMLVVAGVLGAGLFLPGVVLIGISLIGWAVAGALHAARADDPAADTTADG